MNIRVNAVLLDLDGTLLDHGTAAQVAFLATCPEWLPDLDASGRREALAEWQRLETVSMREYLHRTMTFQEQRRARVRGILAPHGESLSDARADELFASYLKRYEASWSPFGDVAAAMGFLRQAPGGVAVLSNGDRHQQQAKLATLGLDCVPRLFVPADVGASKPEPASFLGACVAMGWTPSEVLYVGDDPHTDAVAAARAGLRGCWLERRPTGRTELPVEILRIRSLVDLAVAIRWTGTY